MEKRQKWPEENRKDRVEVKLTGKEKELIKDEAKRTRRSLSQTLAYNAIQHILNIRRELDVKRDKEF